MSDYRPKQLLNLFFLAVITIFKTILHSSILRLIVPPLLGFMFYGSWAYWVNHEFGQPMAFKAALTQGSYSFIMTLLLSIIVEWLYQSLDRFNHHHWLVIALACVLLYFSSWLVNAVAGTPNIFFTILPGAAISTIYTLVYVLTLKKLSKHK